MTPRKTVTPRRAMSKSQVNELQRELNGAAVGLALQARELATLAQRLREIVASFQRSQEK